MNRTASRKLVFSTLFAALISVCAFICVPIPASPVPIVLQNMMAVMSGLLLGSIWGGVSVAIFLIAGALGFPVFSGGGGGLARFASPTGGFLIGYLIAAIVSGMFFAWSDKKGCDVVGVKGFAVCLASSFCGFTLIYVPGIWHFMRVMGKSFSQSIAICLIPYVIPDMIKMFLAAFVSFKVRPAVRGLMSRE